MKITGLILFVLNVLTSCNLTKSEDDKIKDLLIGEYKIDDYSNTLSNSFKNDFGKSVRNTKYIFWKDGKFEYSANLDNVLFYDPMFEEELLDEDINLKFTITGSWLIQANTINFKYKFDKLTLFTEDDNGNYTENIYFFKQFKEKMIGNLETKMKIIDYNPSSITIENSKDQRFTLKKIN